MKHKNRIGLLFIIVGLVLLIIASSLYLKNTNENKKSELAITKVLDDLSLVIPTVKEENENVEMTEENVIINNFYCILKQKDLNIYLPIYNDYTVETLKLYPCRYTDTILCGHNIKAQFSFIHNLKIDDIITIEYFNGKSIDFKVIYKEVISPEEKEKMIDTEYDLTLFTCTSDNADRYTVRLNRID